MVTGQRIAMLRKEKNWGQKKLAAYLKLSVSTISNYENGVHFPDLAVLSKMADIFGVSADYLLGRTDCRSGLLEPEKRLTKEYVLKDLADTVLAVNEEDRRSIVRYSIFLKNWPKD